MDSLSDAHDHSPGPTVSHVQCEQLSVASEVITVAYSPPTEVEVLADDDLFSVGARRDVDGRSGWRRVHGRLNRRENPSAR
jgi:hypothetical protein